MLTNLDFLNPGKTWPVEGEETRMQTYSEHKMLFQGKHDEVYKEAFARIERVIGNFNQIISYPVIINYQRVFTLKIADLLLGEPPKHSSGLTDLTKVSDLEELLQVAYMVTIDMMRYGDGLFYVYSDAKGKAKVGYTQTDYWYPVVNPINIHEVLYHVIAYVVTVGKGADGRDIKELVVNIHSVGSIEVRRYKVVSTLFSMVLGDLVYSEVFQTGLDDFAIVQVSNLKTTDSIYGYDDYTMVDSLVCEILVRIAQISRILDKHTSPTMIVPYSALEEDPMDGQLKLRLGNAIPVDGQHDAKPEYITWDGEIGAAFQALKDLTERLYVISEVGQTLMGEESNSSQATAAQAMRLKTNSAQMKAKRMRSHLGIAMKKVLSLCSQINNVKLNTSDIDILWQDGLPSDPLEEANIMMIRTGNKATMSVKRALETYDLMSDKQAEEELSSIDKDTPAESTPNKVDNNLRSGDDEDVKRDS